MRQVYDRAEEKDTLMRACRCSVFSRDDIRGIIDLEDSILKAGEVMVSKRAPKSVIRRLPVYLRILDHLIINNVEIISSKELSEETGFLLNK